MKNTNTITIIEQTRIIIYATYHPPPNIATLVMYERMTMKFLRDAYSYKVLALYLLLFSTSYWLIYTFFQDKCK